MITSDSAALQVPRHFWRTWLSWVAASTAAIVIGAVLLYALIPAAEAIVPGVNEDRLMGWALIPYMGLMLGVSQWIILHRRVRHAGWWILATAGGWSIVMAASALVMSVPGVAPGSESVATITMPLSTLGAGLLLGVLQLPVLYRYLRWSPLWIVASAAGWLTMGLAIGKSIDRTPDILALGAIPAAFTGLALAWLWIDPVPVSRGPAD